MVKLEYSPMALEDLSYLRDYIIDNWGENIAKRTLKKITSDIKKLETYPLMGSNLAKNTDTPTDYRYLFTEKNYVFYRIEFDNIKIIRVINEKQDYMLKLFGTYK